MNRGGPERRSRKDAYDADGKKPLKSAMKQPKVSTNPNGILKTRNHSPSRSYTSTEGSVDANALVFGYSHNSSKQQQPNVHHKPVLERRRSRSTGRSHSSMQSGSSLGRSSSHDRRRSSDRKKPKPKSGGRMYNEDVFIDDRRRRARSNSLGRSSRRSDRVSDSGDSESTATSYASSKRISMNPGGKRVQIQGTETDL